MKTIIEKNNNQKNEKHTIMVVDDEEAYVGSLESLLSKHHQVITARSGQEALEKIKQMDKPEDISIIISDQRMPGMTGIQLLEEVKNIIPDTLRVILTGYEDKDVMLKAMNEAKVYEFILKPIEPEELRHRVKKCTEYYDAQKKIKEYQKELEELSLTDPLTGLRNRRYLKIRLGDEIAKTDRLYDNWLKIKEKKDQETSSKKNKLEGERKKAEENNLIFIMVDLDRFKSVNDTYDHDAGDKVLIQLSDILRHVFRGTDILVRWGGEEFLVVVPSVNYKQAPELAQRLLDEVRAHSFDIGDKYPDTRIQLTCSIGFACYPFIQSQPQKLNWEKVVDLADQAMFAAKKTSRDAWVGIISTEKATPQNILEKMGVDIAELIENGELKPQTSIQNKKLLWGKKNDAPAIEPIYKRVDS